MRGAGGRRAVPLVTHSRSAKFFNAHELETRRGSLRIRSIHINQWRNFENIELQLDDDAALV